MSTVERNDSEARDVVQQTAELVGGIAHRIKTLWKRAVGWVKVQSVRGYQWVAVHSAPIVEAVKKKSEVAVQYGIGLLRWGIDKAFRLSLRLVGVAGALAGRVVAYGAVLVVYAALQGVGVYLAARTDVRKTIAAERDRWTEQGAPAMVMAA